MQNMMYRILFAVSATVVPMVLSYWIKQQFRNKLLKLQSQQQELGNGYYHCMFWTMENKKCKEHIFNNIECANNCSVTYLQTILKCLSSSKTSISMCMYHLTLNQITEELIKAQRRGITVRIITDYITSRMDHSKMKLLKNTYGFDVRTPPYSDSFMHHKYCVIDAEDSDLQKLFLGSLNLTLQGCVANFEFVVITNNPHMICEYSKEFNLLWDTFEDSIVVKI